VLVVLSLAMFGNYYVYDSISPLADVLVKQLHFTDDNIGLSTRSTASRTSSWC